MDQNYIDVDGVNTEPEDAKESIHQDEVKFLLQMHAKKIQHNESNHYSEAKLIKQKETDSHRNGNRQKWTETDKKQA